MTDKTRASDQKVSHAKPDKSSGEYVDGANVPNPKGAPSDPEDATVFQQGRTAAFGSISEEDAPYDKSDSRHGIWLKGYRSAKG